MAHSDSTHGHTASVGGVEEDHVNVRAIFSFGIGLALVTIVVHLLMLWMWHIEVANIDASNPPRVYPLATQTQEERRGRNVPTAMLYGRVVEHIDMSVEELQRILARLAAPQENTRGKP